MAHLVCSRMKSIKAFINNRLDDSGFWDNSPLSSRPWLRFESFDSLPYVYHWMVVAVWLGPTFALSVFVISKWDDFSGLDPLLGHGCTLHSVIATFVLLLVTGVMIFKQLSYYYEGEGKKDGLFKNKLRQANNRERCLDLLSIAVAPFVVASCLIPTWWFVTVTTVSYLVVWKCHTTLRRPRYIHLFEKYANARGKRVTVPSFLLDRLDQEYNPEKYVNRKESVVKYVLSGWVVSHSIYFLVGLWLFLLFHSAFFSALAPMCAYILFFVLTVFFLYLYIPGFPLIPSSLGITSHDRVRDLPVPWILVGVSAVSVSLWSWLGL